MPIKVQCPGCGKSLHGKDELAGKQVKCSKCGQRFHIPPQNTLRAITSVTTDRSSSPPDSTILRSTIATRKRRRWVAGGALIVACLIVGAVFVVAIQWDGPTQRAGPSGRKVVPKSDSNTLERLLTDIRNHHEEKRGALIPLPLAIAIIEQEVAKDATFSEYSSLTYSTQLNESKLLDKYGQPDEIGDDTI